MSTLDRYILNAFLRNLTLVLLTLISLYGLIEFLESVDDFLEYQADLKYYLLYPLSHLPVMAANSLPMAVLLATFTTIGELSRSNQLTAILGGGISLSRLCRPLFLGGSFLAMLLLIVNLWLAPWSTRESSFIRHSGIKGEPLQDMTSQDLYFREGNKITSISHAFPTKGVLQGLTILELNDTFVPERRIQAESATHIQNDQWLLNNAVIWEFSPETGVINSFSRNPELPVNLNRQPSEMVQEWSNPEELPFGTLLRLMLKLRDEGHDPKAYLIEAHLRFAKAIIPLIMVLIGIPFALQRERNASFALGIVMSLIIFVVYFILYAVFAVFGAIAVLPPLLAAWAANILMALIGTWFFLRAQG